MQKIQRSQRGFTLTEIAIVLGIMGLILGSIWIAAGQVAQNNKVQKAMTEVLSIATAYQSMYSTRPLDTTGDITCMGITSGLFPSDMGGTSCVTGVATSYPMSPWNTQTQVNGDVANNQIDIMVYGLNQKGCNSLADSFYNSPMVVGEKIGRVSNPTVFSGTASPTQVNTACQNATDNVVYLVFPGH